MGCNRHSHPEFNKEIQKQTYQHPIPFLPKSYICYKTNQSIIVDGIVDSLEWNDIPWTEDFVDIQGSLKSIPPHITRAKMTWDNNYFYFAALLNEPNIWATLTERDAIMYKDDDFEIFIEPDGDGHNYFEFEMNAHNAIWDLLMLYPYRIDQKRNYIMNWNVDNIKSAVHIEGTLNNPEDKDEYWSVEVAIPWTAFKDLKKGPAKPKTGDQWRVNFSRVDWTMDISDGQYIKRKDMNGKALSEDNWVWSPTGYINMHIPETWGYVQFEVDRSKTMSIDSTEKIKWALWQLYYQVKECYNSSDEKCDIEHMTVPNVNVENYHFKPILYYNPMGFDLIAYGLNGEVISINEKALLTISKKEK